MKLAIDIGSNTSKCLLGRLDKNGNVEVFFEKSRDCRILAGKGVLVQNAAEMISQSIEYFANLAGDFLKDNPADECGKSFSIAAVATSALRDASNRGEILEKVFASAACKIKIASGREEAELSYAGALSDEELPPFKSTAYFDLGGGSLELVFGDRQNARTVSSLSVGAVVMTKKFFPSPNEVITPSRVEKMRGFLRKTFEEDADNLPSDILIGAGGSVVAARRIAAFYSGKDSGEISLREVEFILEKVCALDLPGRVQKFGVSESRADIIPAAFACIAELMVFLKKDFLRHTYRGLRYGVILENFA